MTKKLSLIPLLTLALIFTSCGMGSGNNSATHDEGVVINGVRWATRNVVNLERVSGFFTFDEAQNACPQGWRLPTKQELQSLVDAGSRWRTRNGVNGRLFGRGRNQLFLPAAGLRDTRGVHFGLGCRAHYWSSTAYSPSHGWNLNFNSRRDSGVYTDADNRDLGFSVRCVAK